MPPRRHACADEDQAGFVSYDLNIFSATTGVLEQTIDVGGTEQEPTTHPDWSPDGSRIVYVRGLLRDPSGNQIELKSPISS